MKKGFTLIELVGVIVILGVIAVFTVPALTKTLKKTADKEYEEFEKNVKLAAENYFHSEIKDSIDTKKFIKVSTLIDNGYLKEIINPLTNEKINNNGTVIVYKDDKGVERYQYLDNDVTVDGYVKRGLVLLYDGYTEPNNNEIIDLSKNGNNGTIVGATWVKNYYDLDGTNDYIYRYMSINGSSATIEICAEYISGNYMLATDAINKNYIFNNSYTKGENNINFANYDNPFATRTIKYYNNNGNATFNGYYNSNASTEASSTGISNGSYLAIGSYYASSASNVSKQKVYSVRVYDVALTDEEIKQNYLVDKYRFGV